MASAAIRIMEAGRKTEPLCYGCTYALGWADGRPGLQCQRTQADCRGVCRWFEREAGADLPEGEAEAPSATVLLFRRNEPDTTLEADF